MLEESDKFDDKKRYIESLNTDIEDLDLLLEELLSYARLDQENTKLELSLEKLTPWLVQLAPAYSRVSTSNQMQL